MVRTYYGAVSIGFRLASLFSSHAAGLSAVAPKPYQSPTLHCPVLFKPMAIRLPLNGSPIV
jgi:hypothetical protein